MALVSISLVFTFDFAAVIWSLERLDKSDKVKSFGENLHAGALEIHEYITLIVLNPGLVTLDFGHD